MCCSAKLRALLLALACVLGAACAADHPCSPEVCDGADNDCDGRIDEDYLDEHDRYASVLHCGSCAIVCSDVFPTARTTECALPDGTPTCRISRCYDGQTLAGDGACVRDLPVLCLPCTIDQDCAARSPGARCVIGTSGSAGCGQACERASDCPQGFRCTSSQCVPSSGACACSDATVGASFGCELRAASTKTVCAGVQHCTAGGLSACEAALPEACNAIDDDCDGAIDEDYTDASGRYIAQLHCGACDTPCSAEGPHRVARCEVLAASASCHSECEQGFVDVNGLAADGCECALSLEDAPVIAGDRDCDGVIDPAPELVFVSKAGDDDHAGTGADTAVLTLTRGLALGAMLGRTVVVARGIYAERVSLVAGVRLVGGYSPDFRVHDAELYPVLLESPPGDSGAAVLSCHDIDSPTLVADLTIAASDATGAGQGSTAVLLSGCGDAVELRGLTVLAGRAGNGSRGVDSSERLADRGLTSLAQLAGVAGGSGAAGGVTGCAPVAAGGGGAKLCSGRDVSGGAGGEARCASLACDNTSMTPCGNAGCSDFTRDGVCDIAAARSNAVVNSSAQDGRGAAPGHAAEATFDAPTNHRVCSFCDDNPSLPRVGSDGADGSPGEAGAAGAACDASYAVVDADGRVQAGAGRAGADGHDGSGGGGGTAGAGYAVIAGTEPGCSSIPGGAGGGAGSAGCGAPGAAGGGGGGSSVGVLIRLAAATTRGPRLIDVRVVTASGGDGGDGGIGVSGGPGGSGGLGGGSSFWCARTGGRGGDGGSGGDGGGGGGGCGGDSLGIYVIDANASQREYVTELGSATHVDVAGAAGRGGRGGFSPTHAGVTGVTGTAAAVDSAAD